MTYRYTRRPTPRAKSYAKLSIPELKALETKLLSSNPDLEARLKEHAWLTACKKQLQDKYEHASDELSRIRKDYERRQAALQKLIYERKGFLGKAMYKLSPPEPAKEPFELAQARKTFSRVYDEVAEIDRRLDSLSQSTQANTDLRKIRWNIQRKTQMAVKEGIVAAKTGADRELAQKVKRDLEKQLKTFPFCPYCERPLGHNPHCDHIRPISLGGLSTHDNMVYVCNQCNSKKRDLTLAQFIKRNSLNRERIESHLDALHKVY